MMPMEGKKSFKLTEVAQHTYIMPGGFYRGFFCCDHEPEKIRQPFCKGPALNGVFGLPLSSMAGQVWDSIDVDSALPARLLIIPSIRHQV